MPAVVTCPRCPVDVVLDTDAYNEIDDQFAIAYLLAASDALHTKAIYAAPFRNAKADSPAEGMEKSYQEILRILKLAERGTPPVFRGSCAYLSDEKTPVVSQAAENLAKLAMEYSKDHPLYVLAIGAITNVASAILLNRQIVERIVIIWLGGMAYHWENNHEFNLRQDIAAARIVFDSGAALVQIPCNGVTDILRTTRPELEYWLKGTGPLNDYLVENTVREAQAYAADKPWSRVIWDITVVAWMLDADRCMMRCKEVPSPIAGYNHQYAFDDRRHRIQYVYKIDRDAVFEDLFKRLVQAYGRHKP